MVAVVAYEYQAAVQRGRDLRGVKRVCRLPETQSQKIVEVCSVSDLDHRLSQLEALPAGMLPGRQRLGELPDLIGPFGRWNRDRLSRGQGVGRRYELPHRVQRGAENDAGKDREQSEDGNRTDEGKSHAAGGQARGQCEILLDRPVQ